MKAERGGAVKTRQGSSSASFTAFAVLGEKWGGERRGGRRKFNRGAKRKAKHFQKGHIESNVRTVVLWS